MKKISRRQFLAVSAAAGVAGVLTACGSSSSAAPAASAAASQSAAPAATNKTVTMAVTAAWDTLSPLAADTNGDDYFQTLLWDRMFMTKLDGTFEPHLCDKYEMVDEKTMQLTINADAMWSDGEPVTSADMLWTAQALSSADIAAPRAFIMKYLDGTDSSGIETAAQSVNVEVVDEKTVNFHFKNAIDPEMFIKMFNLNFFTLPAHCFEGVAFADVNNSDFWNAPVSDGPVIYSSMVKDERIEYTANKEYYLGAPDFDKFVLRVVSKENLLPALMSEEIDIIAGAGSADIPVSDWPLAQQQDNLVTESAVGPGYWNLTFNMERKYMTPKAKQAFEMAINKQALVDAIFAGEAEVANMWVPTTSPYYNSAVESMNQYDPEAAKALLDESGWDYDQELLLFGYANRVNIVEMIQQDLQSIGVKVNLETADGATVVSKLSGGEVDIGFIGTAGTLDPDNCAINFTVGGPFCFANIKDSTWTDAVTEGASKSSFEERKEIYDKLAVRIKEEVPYIYLYFTPEFVAYNKKLSNVDITDFFSLQYSVWNWKVEQ